MGEPGTILSQDELRNCLNDVLETLRLQQTEAGRSEKGRALGIAITQMEIASMCVIRSFFADKPYSPLQLLQPKAA